MRTIKFRAWDLYGKLYLNDYEAKRALFMIENGDFEKDHFVFEQYTGIKDKNGKEIYDGDIVYYNASEVEHGTAEIGFLNGCFMFKWDIKNCSFNEIMTASYFFGCASELEIIGNIREHKGFIYE